MAKAGRKAHLTDPQMVWARIDGRDYDEILRIAEEHGLPKAHVVHAMVRHCLDNLTQVNFPTKPTPQQEALELKAS